jgi:cytolysin (calcineurin-like family phosphatase)
MAIEMHYRSALSPTYLVGDEVDPQIKSSGDTRAGRLGVAKKVQSIGLDEGPVLRKVAFFRAILDELAKYDQAH